MTLDRVVREPVRVLARRGARDDLSVRASIVSTCARVRRGGVDAAELRHSDHAVHAGRWIVLITRRVRRSKTSSRLASMCAM